MKTTVSKVEWDWKIIGLTFAFGGIVFIVHMKWPAKPTSSLQHIKHGSLTDIMAIWLNVCLLHCIFLLSPAEPSENLREILQNVAKSHGVSNMRKLGHLNNFIKVMLLCDTLVLY